MFNPNKLKRNLKMKKSIIILIFIFVSSQLRIASSTFENVPSITEKTEWPKPHAQANTANLEDVKENKKSVVLLVPIENSEEIYDDYDEEGEEEVEEPTTEQEEDATHHNHKTKRCKSFRTPRRISMSKDSRKYISASTESSLDESVENPIGGPSLFRVASVKDAKNVLKNLLKSRSRKEEDDTSLDRFSKPEKNDAIRFISDNSDREGRRSKNCVSYCAEEDDDLKKSGKRPFRTYAVRKRIGQNFLNKSLTNYEGQDIRGPKVLHSEEVLGTPHNLYCPPEDILTEEPEYVAQLAIKRQKQNFRNRPTKNWPETILHPDSETQSLGRPTNIEIPLAVNRKWNRRVYKVNSNSPFVQKLQSVLKQKEAEDRIPCPDSESTYNDPQSIRDHYKNEQSNYDQYNQIALAPSLVYPDPRVVYPQYPQYPQYVNDLHNPIRMEPRRQDFVSHQEPSYNHQYIPTPLGKNFIDINQCIELFGPYFCIVTTTTISPISGPYHANDFRNKNEDKKTETTAQWQEDTLDTTKMPQQKTSKYAYNTDEPTTYYYGLAATQHHEENLPGSQKYHEDDSQLQYGGRTSSRPDYDHVTTSRYHNEPITLKIQANDEASQSADYKTIGSKHETQDYGDYENFVESESPIRHSPTNSEYLTPIEDNHDSESVDYLDSSEETNENNILQKTPEENVSEGSFISVTKNLQGAHKISSPQFVQYTLKPAGRVSTSDRENTSHDHSEYTSNGRFEDNSEYIQATQDSKLSDYDRSEFPYSSSEPSNEESVGSFTELPSDLVYSTIDRPQDNSRTTLLLENEEKNKLDYSQQITTMYPIFNNEDQTVSTSHRVHDSNHESDVYSSTVSNQAEENFESHIPKTTNSYGQFVGISESALNHHPSDPAFISSTTAGDKNYYSSSHAADYKAEDATMSFVVANELQNPTYTSTPYSKMYDAEEMKTNEYSQQEIEEDEEDEEVPTTLYYETESRLGDSPNKYSKNKIHYYIQPKQPESNSGPIAAKTTTSYEKLLGKSQSPPKDNFASSTFVPSMTVDSDNQYTTFSAMTPDSKYGPTSSLKTNGPVDQEFYSTMYPNTDTTKIEQDYPEHEETSIETPSSSYTSQSRNNYMKNRKYITTEKTFYPHVESYQATLYDSSTQPEQVGNSFESSKVSSHYPILESITRSKSSDGFERHKDTSNEPTSHVTIKNSKYDTKQFLRGNKLEENLYTFHSPYSTSVTDESRPTTLWQHGTEEYDEDSTEKIPSSDYYITQSKNSGVHENRWLETEKNFHQQHVEGSQPMTGDILQPEDTSTETNGHDVTFGVFSRTPIGSDSYKSNSYSIVKDTNHFATSSSRAEKPEGRTFSSTSYPITQDAEEMWTTDSWPKENEEKQQGSATGMTWSQYYPTQSEMQEPNVDQHFQTNKYGYPQFVGSHQSVNVESSTRQGQERENFGTHRPTLYQPSADKIGQLDTLTDFATVEDEDTTTSHATMENLRYDTTPLLGGTEREESEFSSYLPDSSTIEPGRDITASSWPQNNEKRVRGKVTSLHPQFLGNTQSNPVYDFSQSALTLNSVIGDNSHYTTSSATIENSEYDRTPQFGTPEPEEESFTSPSVYPPTIDQEGDTTTSSWSQYTENHNTDDFSMNQNRWIQSGKTGTVESYPQFAGTTEFTPVDDFSQPGVITSDTKIDSNHHYTTSYATMENMDHSTTSILGAKEPEEEILYSTIYPGINDAEEIETPFGQQQNTDNYQNNYGKTRFTQYYPTQSNKVQDTNLGQDITTGQKVHPQILKTQQWANDVTSSTGFNTQQYSTTVGNYHPQLRTETPEDTTIGNTDEQSTNWYYPNAHPKPAGQNSHRQFMTLDHLTTAPRFEPDSGIKEQTEAYFTSKAYHDSHNPVMGPDSYFEGDGLQNWNDFTSMSYDDVTTSDTNGVEAAKQPTTVNLFVPEKQEWATTEISPGQRPYYEDVGEERPHKERITNNEFTQKTTESDFSPRQIVQKSNEDTHRLHFGHSHEDTSSTSFGDRTGKEESGKCICESVSRSSISDTPIVESHSMGPKVWRSENQIREMMSRKNYGIDYTTSYEPEDDTLDNMTLTEKETDKQTSNYDDTTSPYEDYDYTNEYSTLDKSPTTELSKDHDNVSIQSQENTFKIDPSLNHKATTSNINYGTYMNSEDDFRSRSSESVAVPNSNTASNLLESSATKKFVEYKNYRDSGLTHELEYYPYYVEEQTSPTLDSSEEISSEDQLSPEDRNTLRTTVEKVVNDLIFPKSDKPDNNDHVTAEVIGAPLMVPGLPELSILKNLFSLPEVRNMAIGAVKGLMSKIGDDHQVSPLRRLADRLIGSVLNGVINNMLPSLVTTPSSAIVDEHRYENGKWTVVPVTLVPSDDRVGNQPDDKLLSTNKDICEQKTDDEVLSAIKNIVRSPGIGLHGAQLPFVQNIIVRTVENTLRNAEHTVNHSVIWDTLNNMITRAESSSISPQGIETPVESNTKPNKEKETANVLLGAKKPGRPFKIAPIIAVTEHVLKNGNWVEEQTVLRAKKKDYGSMTSTTFATDHQLHTSPSRLKTSATPKNQYDYTTKPLDYAFLGESEEDDGIQDYDSTTDIFTTNEEIPKQMKTLDNNEDGLDNSPIKYYSPNDRILSYIKNHQAPAEIVESQGNWEDTSDSSNREPIEDYSTSEKIASNELTEKTDDITEISQENQTNDSIGSRDESKTCKCTQKTVMKNTNTEASTEKNHYSDSAIHSFVEHENLNSGNYGEGNLLTTLQSQKNVGEELGSTEPSEFSSTIHHLDVDQDKSNKYTTEEYVANENPSASEEFDRNTAERSQKKSEEIETSYVTTDSMTSGSIFNTDQPTKNTNNQIISTSVYVYGVPVGNTQFTEGTLNSDGQNVECAHTESINGANVITTENIDEITDELEAPDQIMDLSGTSAVSDVFEENLGAVNDKPNDQSITTPVYVYGTEVHGIDPQESTNWGETTTQNLHQQFSGPSEYHDCFYDPAVSTMKSSEENIENTQLPQFQTTDHHSDTRNNGQPNDYNTEEYIMIKNALAKDNSEKNSFDETSIGAAENNESFLDGTTEISQADHESIDNDSSTPVYVNSDLIQETKTQTLLRKLPKILNSYVSAQEDKTSSQSLIGAAKNGNGKPGLFSLIRDNLNRPRNDIPKDYPSASRGKSNYVTPKYDPTYFGKISLNGVNPGGDSISDLTDSDLFYVGDGVKVPLTIQRMPDGSYALSISDKICENFVKRRCPCCVPDEGNIVEERRRSNEAEEYNAETSSKEDYNYDSFEPTKIPEFQEVSKKRYVRSTSGSDVMVTSATPVKNFVKKYNLTLNLEKHSPTFIRRNDEDAEEMENTRRKTRLSFSKDTKIHNLYGNNNEIQRDDSEEMENRIIEAPDSDTVSKESNSIRRAEYIFDTDTNDFIQSLLYIKDLPEDKRTEVVLNALDGLVNAGKNSDSTYRYIDADTAREIPSGDQNPWVGSDGYDLEEMENEMARYGYQKDNPILKRIRFIKAQLNSHGQYQYQKNIDHRAKGKMNMLKTVLQWLREVFLETNTYNKS